MCRATSTWGTAIRSTFRRTSASTRPEIEIPRGAIPHILEHAGVFVGWNCAGGDTKCQAAEQKLEEVVRGRIDVDQDRVVMAHDNDLVPGTFGLSSWTRVMDFSYKKYDSKAVTAFISKNSCRVDFEGFCVGLLRLCTERCTCAIKPHGEGQVQGGRPD